MGSVDAGLAEDVENHDLKQALLSQIYEANVFLQKAGAAGEIEANAALAAGVQPPPPSSPR